MTYWDFFVAGLVAAGYIIGWALAAVGVMASVVFAFLAIFDGGLDLVPWWARILAGAYIVLALVAVLSLIAWVNQ